MSSFEFNLNWIEWRDSLAFGMCQLQSHATFPLQNCFYSRYIFGSFRFVIYWCDVFRWHRTRRTYYITAPIFCFNWTTVYHWKYEIVSANGSRDVEERAFYSSWRWQRHVCHGSGGESNAQLLGEREKEGERAFPVKQTSKSEFGVRPMPSIHAGMHIHKHNTAGTWTRPCRQRQR